MYGKFLSCLRSQFQQGWFIGQIDNKAARYAYCNKDLSLSVALQGLPLVNVE